ncbi:MAG: hypothetical protein L0Z51_07750 [Candidatus Latescibacteria bacterium]|nr:hypothetical protein [Candidatus Latescibacterota bacterium]
MRKHPAVSALLVGSTAMAVAVVSGCDKASTTDPDPPAGGQSYVLDFDTFANTINPILSAQGCDNLTCHGGGIRGTFELSPNGNKNVQFDFEQARLQVDGANPVASPLVMKPLAPECGGPGHAGGYVFTELDDPDYLTILAWIEAGEYR